jgi:hypothetical protein
MSLETVVAFLEKERGNLMKAPFAFVTLCTLCLGLGYGAGMLYYSSQIGSLHEQTTAKDGQLSRYRVALGIDPASKGALVELGNQELALKAQSIIAKLREFDKTLDDKGKAIKELEQTGKISTEDAHQARLQAKQDVSEAFDQNLASDAYNVENELRVRLDPSALSHVVRVPAFISGSDPHSRVTFSELARGSGFDAMMLGRLADEMEEMAKLLPPDSEKKQ